MNSEMEETGTFLCSDDRVNQMWSNINWSMRGNFLDIPTDCPQRDDREELPQFGKDGIPLNRMEHLTNPE